MATKANAPIGNDNAQKRDTDSGTLALTRHSSSIPEGQYEYDQYIKSLGDNPFNLSGKLREIHFIKKSDMGILNSQDIKTECVMKEYNGGFGIGGGTYYDYKDLSFPHGDKSRSYYQTGDVILVAELRPAILRIYGPEVEKLLGSSIIQMLANSLDMKITCGWTIVSISETKLWATFTLMFGRDFVVLVDDIFKEWKRKQLEDNIIYKNFAADKEFIKTMAPIIAELATGVLKGVATKAVKSLGFHVAKAQLKKKLSRYVLLTAISKAVRLPMVAAKAFLKAAAIKYVEVSLKPGGLTDKDRDLILLAGCTAGITSMISAQHSDLWEQVPDGNTFKERLAKRVAKEMTAIIPNITKQIVNAFASEADKSTKWTPDKIESVDLYKEVGNKLDKQWDKVFIDAFKNILSNPSELSAVTEQ